MIPRLRQIVLLLSTSERYLDEFSSPSSVQFASQSGPAPGKKETCRRCGGIKKVKGTAGCGMCATQGPGKHGCEQCDECNGSGRAWYDSYVGHVKALDTELRKAAAGKSRKRPSFQGRDIPEEMRHAARILGAKAARDRSGSYKALDAALARLKEADEVSHYLLVAKYREMRYGIPTELLEPIHLQPNGHPKPNVRVATLPLEHELAILRGLKRLDEWLPQLNLPREILTRELDNNGMSTSKQARAQGVSKMAIRRARRRAA